MKYIVVLGDGMADEDIEALGGKTPLEYAATPTMDHLAPLSEVGMLHTIPQGMKPGSDTANLSVLGYDPRKYYSGRSPLEALSMGVPMRDTDIAYRCNLVTITEDEGLAFEDRVILDHSSGEISTAESTQLLEVIKKELQRPPFYFYPGVSYRHCLIWEEGQVLDMAQPHDHLDQVIGQWLPTEGAFLDMMKRSFEILKDHPINIERRKKGLNPANCCWFWGAGTKPSLPLFTELYGKNAAMISAVDLLKGIAVGAGMKVIDVEGADGGLDTNYEGKAQAALKTLLEDGSDFVYIHVEAPDEMGHQGSYEKKVKAIERLDQRIIKPVLEGMEASGEAFRMLVCPDHPTPVRLRTHTSDSVPYMIYDSADIRTGGGLYNERAAAATGKGYEDGEALMKSFLA